MAATKLGKRQLKNNTETVTYSAAHYQAPSNENVTGSVSWDLNAAPARKLTLTGNITMSNPTNKTLVQTGILVIVQDATGSRTVTWSSDYSGMNGDAIPDIQTAANSVTILFYVCDGTKVYIR